MSQSNSVSNSLKAECNQKTSTFKAAAAASISKLQNPDYEITGDYQLDEILRRSYMNEWESKLEKFTAATSSMECYYDNLILRAEREEREELFKDSEQTIRRANVSYDLLQWMVKEKKYLPVGNACAYNTMQSMISCLEMYAPAFMWDFHMGNDRKIKNMSYAEFILNIWDIYIEKGGREMAARKDSDKALSDSIGWSIQTNLAEFVLFLNTHFAFGIILEVNTGYGIELYKTSGFEGVTEHLGYINLTYSPEFSTGHFMWVSEPHKTINQAKTYRYLSY